MRVFGAINSGEAAGVDGAATSTNTSSVRVVGKVVAVAVRCNSPCLPATMSVVVKAVGTAPSAPTFDILNVSSIVDGLFFPRVEICDVDGAGLSQYDKYALYDYVSVTIDGANVGDDIDVWLMLAEE